MVTTEQPIDNIGINGTGPHRDDSHRKQRASHLRWIRIGDLVPAPRAQRAYDAAWAHTLAAAFDLEGMGYPVVSHRGSTWWIIDGQHRIAALKVLDFSLDDTVQCEVYEGLTEQEEAALFLERNNVKSVGALDKFLVGVNAEREEETKITGVVQSLGLNIGRHNGRAGLATGTIASVSALRKVYRRVGAFGLELALRIIRDAYGNAGFDAFVIDGLGLVVQRYDHTLSEERMVQALASAHGGLNGLLTQAEKERNRTAQTKAQCIASVAVEFYNRSAGSKKLAPWWKG